MSEASNLIIRVEGVFEASANGAPAIAALLLIVLAMLGYGWLRRRV